jgi:hypothetical protein
VINWKKDSEGISIGPNEVLSRYVPVRTQLLLLLFFFLVCEAIGAAVTHSLLRQPRVIVKMIVEKHMECRLAGETEVLGESLPQSHFCPS